MNIKTLKCSDQQGSINCSLIGICNVRKESSTRTEMLKRLNNLKKKKVELESMLTLYKENDPEYLKEVAKETNVSNVSANRWTDNIFALHSWIGNNFPSISINDLNKQFGVPDDLDYVE